MPASSSSEEAAPAKPRGREPPPGGSSSSEEAPKRKPQPAQPKPRQESSSSSGDRAQPARKEEQSDSEEEGERVGGRQRAPRRSEDSAAGRGSSDGSSDRGRRRSTRASEDSAAGRGSFDSRRRSTRASEDFLAGGEHSDSEEERGAGRRGRALRASEDSAAGGTYSDSEEERGAGLRGKAPRGSEDSAAGGDYSDSEEERGQGRRRSSGPRGSEDSALGGEHSGSEEEEESGSAGRRAGARRGSEETPPSSDSELHEQRRREAASLKIQTMRRGQQARRHAASLRQSHFVVEDGISDTPAPGTRGPLAELSTKELRMAFQMLDDRKAGVLDRVQARNWLRCAGWALADPQLDALLDSSSEAMQDASTRHATWSLPSLLQVLEFSQDEENLSVEALEKAFRTLAQGRADIDRRRLGELLELDGKGFEEADLDDVLELVGLAGETVLDCKDVSLRILDAVRLPPTALEQHQLGRKSTLPRYR